MEGGGGDEEIYLHKIYIRNETTGKLFRLVPRWESCAPQPEAAHDLLTFSKPSLVSDDPELRVAPSLSEVNDLVFNFEASGHPVCSISLAPCKSRLEIPDLGSVEGAVYINLEIYPDDGRASLRLYEVGPGKVTWISTGFYIIGLVSSEVDLEAEVLCPDLGRDQCLKQTLRSKPFYFHGKGSAQLSLPPLKVNFERDFTLVKRIGKGTEGTVSRCLSKFSSCSSAVKKTDLQNLFVRSTHSEPREVNVLSMLRHDNIAVPYLAWSEASTSRYTSAIGCAFVSMKIYDKSLHQYLNARPVIDLENNQYIFRQIMEALNCMHKNGIVHRDIKPQNILIEPDLKVTLIDFGIAKEIASSKDLFDSAGGVYGSLPYSAPELSNFCTGHDEKVDVFSAGIVYYELHLLCRKQSKETLKLLQRSIRVCAQELDRDLLGKTFDLDAALEGTALLENWSGDVNVLKRMISPRSSERQSALELLKLFDLEVPDNRYEASGI